MKSLRLKSLLFLALAFSCFQGMSQTKSDSMSVGILGLSLNSGSRYLEVGKSYQVGPTLVNLGKTTWEGSLKSCKINYQLNDEPVVSYDYKPAQPLAINYLTPNGLISEDNPLKITQMGNHKLVVWIDNFDGSADYSLRDDTLRYEIVAVESKTLASRNTVILEEFTGAWCVWCPRGMETVEKMTASLNQKKDAFGNQLFKFAPTMIHVQGNDPMEFDDSKKAAILSLVTGFPSGSVDRAATYDIPRNPPAVDLFPVSPFQLTVSTFAFDKLTRNRISSKTPATVSHKISYDENAKKATVDFTAKFMTDMSSDLRFVTYVVRDKVTGGTEYDQRIAQPLTEDPKSKWYGAADPMTDFEHQHVLSLVPTGVAGIENSVPFDNKKGDVVKGSVEFDIDGTWDAENLLVYTFLFKNDSKNFLNYDILDAAAGKLLQTNTVSTDAVKSVANSVNIAPNPTAANSSLSYNLTESANVTVRVMNTMGQVLSNEKLGNQTQGTHSFTVDSSKLTNGIYYVSLTAGNNTFTKKLVINK